MASNVGFFFHTRIPIATMAARMNKVGLISAMRTT
jgi:hypothetical protein